MPGAIAAAFLAVLPALVAASSDPVTRLVPTSDPHVAVMGRADRPGAARIRFGYPGVTVRLRFEGPSLALLARAETPHTHLDVIVDGGPPRILRLRQGESEVSLAEGLGTGPHQVDVVHRTETWMSVVDVQGFRLGPGGRLLDPEPWPSRRLLFIGDSVTCGERIDREPGETEPFASSNGRLSYGMRLARALDAQAQLVCYGGRGLVRDWRGRSDVLTGPQLFDLAVADEVGGPAWDHAEYRPDAVFVSLGTNDFNLALGPLPEREPFVSAYVRFVATIRARYPEAHVFLTEGAIVNDEADPKRPQKTVLREYLVQASRRLADARVHVVPSNHYPGDASNPHPTREQHAAMARDLEPILREALGWNNTPQTAMPVSDEPFHRPVLRNAFVEALHVTIPAAKSTQWHTHAHDGVAIRLTRSTVAAEAAGRPRTKAGSVEPGDVSAAPYAKHPLTHRVHNEGETNFEVIDVALLRRPDGPTLDPIAPVAAENDAARVYRWALAPGASTPPHTHARPYLVVAATPLQLQMKAADGATMRHSVKAGDLHWVDARVTHALTNAGTEAGVIVEVELK